MIPKEINIINPILLVQEIKVIHSLCENGITIYCNNQEYNKLKFLKDVFNFDIKIGIKNGIPELKDVVKINHNKPETSINNIVKPLFFPKTLIKKCNEFNHIKSDKIYFRGLLTNKRHNSFSILTNKTKHEIICESTMNGREFPIKSFDIEYYENMSKYQFVFCPDGDFTWSYRFFESIMCGSIPIIENESEIFKGFFYYKLSDNIENLKWDVELSNKNYIKLMNEFTL